nr:MAG: ORF1 [TTV-like mini virus]
MPYYYRRPWRTNRYRWRRWYKRRRPRGYFRRRQRWRRRRRVRRKLPKLNIKEWQPQTIRKCCIKGMHCLFLCTEETISRNYRMYEHSIIPERWPGGGGFSVTKYSIDGLYEQHQLDRNWWTNSNTNLPLCRYTGCKIKFYQSWEVDYVCNTSLNYPMLATELLYHSCQPSFMMMNKNCIFVPSKITKKIPKGYITKRFRPPNQMSNRWFFAKDLSKVGLLMLTAAAASFDHYYIATDKTSNNCSFTTLNPYLWKKHNFIQPDINGYSLSTTGTVEKRMFATTANLTSENAIQLLKPTQLIYLGWTKKDQPGQTVSNENKNNYLSDHKYWGNPFTHEVLTGSQHVLVTTNNWNTITQKLITNFDAAIGTGFLTTPTEPLLHECRYSPDRDTGAGTKVYLKSVLRDESGWEPPTNEELITEGFPLWLSLFGFVDWHKKLGLATSLYTSYVIVIESNFITPQLPYYILLDQHFIEGKSRYMTEHDTDQQTQADKDSWYPCVKYQLQSIENIVKTGPGIPKLGGRKSVEAKIFYKFYFKFGGCPPKMDTINDPTKQETYPVPGFQSATYSLQNPTLPQETYLYQFDVHQDILTKKAAKRITRDWETQKTLFSTTGRMEPAPYSEKEAEISPTPSDSEEDSALLQIKLRKLKRQRLYLEQQIQQLMEQP